MTRHVNYNYNIIATIVQIYMFLHEGSLLWHIHVLYGMTRFDLTLAINRCRALENAMERTNRNDRSTAAPELNP